MSMQSSRFWLIFWSLAVFFGPSGAEATPQFARQHRVDCSYCHVAPPRLNERGLAFLLSGYRLESGKANSTLPLAVWNTFDFETRHSADFTKAFPSRIELISAGPIGSSRTVYFAEWRALSQSIGGNRHLLDRSGRFEDLFLNVPLSRGGAFSATVGQFRALTQVDVSQRLSLSEPLAFSAGLTGRRAASTRLTGLRSFSASGRQPAVRVEFRRSEDSPTAGWFGAATLPLTGELTIPFTDAASFELEGRPKGVFLEVYRRAGLSSVGGHVFIGDNDRRLATIVGTYSVRHRVALLGAIGRFGAAGSADTRFSVGGEFAVTPALIGGLRLDHRTTLSRDPALLVYGNGHLPFAPAAWRQALRLQIEHRVEASNHITSVALSHIF
jgi:hypothetical protein